MATPDPGASSRRHSLAPLDEGGVAAAVAVPTGAAPVVPAYVPPAHVYVEDEDEVEEMMRPQRQVLQPVGGGASSGPSTLCIICTMMISMIVASAATFYIINKNRTLLEATTLTTPSTPKPHVVFPTKNDTGLDGGDLHGAEEDHVMSDDGESTVAQDT
ncbi:uncharacterized protein LOC119381382 [Rhipicephalus sanguineus]|uniref:uncharacterized protein LOC119381382 n=1 Tax=Rhipicephalus sanguineus TaxID=34632 RepID=UPI00189405B8|nr:uncharacterized protein LOC119381382 [Rhipicephalus sanguineus]